MPETLIDETENRNILHDINIQPVMYHELWEKSTDNQTKIHRPISQKDTVGIPIPVWENKEDSYFV